MDYFKNKTESYDFDGKYYRSSLQGVVNLGRLLSFEDWTNTINLQAHTGLGFSFMTNDKFDGNDDMTNFILGLTAQFRLSNRFALNADFSMINNVNQQYTFDGIEDPAVKEDRGFNSTLYNMSLGLSVYLGKNEKHADWDTSNSRMDELERKLTELEAKMKDSDNDGVADYLDIETGTKENAIVDTKGRTTDENNNKVDDNVELYVDNTVKELQNEKDTSSLIEDLINGGYVNVYFDFNAAKPIAPSYDAINFVTQYLRTNPSKNIDIIGFSDEIGNSAFNKTLSTNRANFVKEVISKAGVSASRLNVIGQGEDTSVDANSAEARKIVRRVTFKIK